ncbi:MFS transporter [uncultured Prevotella sp.]|uniref:MFS transporter n=1 Tax=uncultured Prevotella sp. TaxID=159272 RepID=UPI0025DB5A97|nr:MFS transporter [uncultured Prevotella sp.]
MKERLFTRSYMFILAANFLLFFGFWLLIPVLPFYLKETYNCPEAMLGAILCCYTVSGLCVRPFSGFLMDKFPRKPIYILCYFICASIFLGYMTAGVLTWFIILRALHGIAFSSVTVGGNTLCVDITPSSRRGEALGYYGLTNNTAMALGPMTGLFMHDHVSYEGIFITGMLFSIIGLLCAFCVKARTPESIIARKQEKQQTGKDPVSSQKKLSLDRFILLKGIPVSISLLMLSIPYGATTNFVAMYAREINLDVPSGFFFTLMAVGMGASRLVAGKKVDQGYITQCIHIGLYPVILAFFMLSMCRFIAPENMNIAECTFFAVPLLLGIGFGIIFPAMNTLYINLAPNNKRATATSTYLTAWDVGIGIGIASSGIIAQHFTFYMVYLIGSILCTVSLIFFVIKVTPHYNRNKLR